MFGGLLHRLFNRPNYKAMYDDLFEMSEFGLSLAMEVAERSVKLRNECDTLRARVAELESECEAAAEQQVTVGVSIVKAHLSDDARWLCFDLSDGRKQALPLDRVELMNDRTLKDCFDDLAEAGTLLESALQLDPQGFYRINYLADLAARGINGMVGVIREATEAVGVDSSVIQTPGALGKLIKGKCSGCKPARKKVGSK